MRVLLVWRGQLSCEGLPLPLGCPKVNHRTERGIDWRINGPKGCSRGEESLLHPRKGFCLVWPAKSVSWLLLVNRFTVLNIEEVNTDTHEPIDTPSSSAPDRKALPWKPKWEKRLPKRLSTNTLDTRGTSIILPIEISTTNTSKVHSVKMLLDSGAMGNFIDKDFVHTKDMSTQSISRPILVYNMDGSPNEAGQISEVVDVVLYYKTHSERMLLAVSSLRKQSMILSYTWLKDHNLEVNWQTEEVQMNRCSPQCEECHVIQRE